MARQARYDLAQTCRPRKLAVEQRNELSLGRQPPYPRIGAVIFHKSVEPIPRNMLQQPVKYAILMQHGLILFPVQNVAKRLEHRRINAMRLVHKKRTGQPWPCAGHPRPWIQQQRTWMAETSARSKASSPCPAMTDGGWNVRAKQASLHRPALKHTASGRK